MAEQDIGCRRMRWLGTVHPVCTSYLVLCAAGGATVAQC